MEQKRLDGAWNQIDALKISVPNFRWQKKGIFSVEKSTLYTSLLGVGRRVTRLRWDGHGSRPTLIKL